MKHTQLSRHLPYPPQAVYELILDVSSYPIIFPLVDKAELMTQKTRTTDTHVKLTFKLPAILQVADPVHIARVSGKPHHRIEAKQVQSPLKHLEMGWDLNLSATGGTDMTFYMAFDAGLGYLANSFLNANLDGLIAKAMGRFEAHAAQTLNPVAVNQSPVKGPSRKGSRRSPE